MSIVGICATSPAAIERVAQQWRDAELARHVNRRSRSDHISGPDEDGQMIISLALGFTHVDVVFVELNPGGVFILGANLNDGYVGNDCFAPHVLHTWALAIEKELA